MTDPADRLESELEAALAADVVGENPREAYQRESRSRYRAAVSVALRDGWSFRALAKRAGCTVQHVTECFHLRRNPGDWMFIALPEPSQEAHVRAQIKSIRKAGGTRNAA